MPIQINLLARIVNFTKNTKKHIVIFVFFKFYQEMGRGKAWAVDEDKQLCRSWMNISQDPINSNQQKSDTFWNRIWKHFQNNYPFKPEEPEYFRREVKGLQNRWSSINHDNPKLL